MFWFSALYLDLVNIIVCQLVHLYQATCTTSTLYIKYPCICIVSILCTIAQEVLFPEPIQVITHAIREVYI